MTMMVKIFLCMTFFSVFRQALLEKARIAIVGSGIGGSSCSYFLRERLKNNIDIDLYEANEIGGRLAVKYHHDEIYELGGSIIHERNKYMNMFCEKFKLKKVGSFNNLLAIRDSDGFKFSTSTYKLITYAKVIWKYGIPSLYRLRSFINHILDQFDNIYKLQEDDKAFATVEELFNAVDPNFLTYFKTSVDKGYQKLVYMNKKTTDELVKATIRANYGQSTDVHMFLGSVSVAGVFYSMWGIRDGNMQVPQKLVQNSGVKFLNNLVLKITLDDQTKEYIVESESTLDNTMLTKRYDIVVIANPITADSKTPIEFVNFNPSISVAGQYQRTVVTLVAGNLEPSFYRLSKNYIPDVIIDNDDSAVNSLGRSWPVSRLKNVNEPVWKIHSQRPLTENELKDMFQKAEVIGVKDWLAYPKYEKLSVEDGNFVLHDRLFYVNAIEWAASAMEMSVIGAKNVALLVEKELRSTRKV